MNLKKIWNFIWKEESILSYIVNLGVAFLIVKFLLYPGIGLLLGTPYPIVAVVSSSMEHNQNFENWWENNQNWYSDMNIKKEDFEKFRLINGFNKGDIVALISSKNVKVGDIIVFKGSLPYPIIHRVVKINEDGTFQTKGDNNINSRPDEMKIPKNEIYGKAYIRVPWFGWIKILAVDGISMVMR